MKDRDTRIAVLDAIFGCGNAVAGEVLPLARWEQADRGDPILHQGDDCNSCHFVVSGRVDYFADKSFNYPTLAEGYKIAALDVWNRLQSQAADVVALHQPGH